MSIGLGLAFIAMFTVSFYLLATEDRPTHRRAPVVRSPVSGTAVRCFLDYRIRGTGAGSLESACDQ
ncbi:hypothetical protein OH687_15180 [Burkholderia anthina]|nr:hypothetical protein OH687_15180 [Burkholderia anthina]